MNDGIEWFRTFLDVEWAALQAYHLEPDEDAFLARLDAYEALKEEDIGLALNRLETPEALERLRKQFVELERRVLFAVKSYELEGTPSWAFITSNHSVLRTGRAFSSAFVVQRTAERYEVVAEYERCSSCKSTGRVGDDICEECEGGGFLHWEGEELGPLVGAIEVRRLEPPTHPSWIAAYEAL